MQPFYLAGYDVEQPTCVDGVRALVAVHRRLQIPATFFLVGLVLEHNRAELRDLLSDALFEVGSHTYSHCHLEQADPATARDELRRTGDLIDDVFGRRPVGLRTPGGTERGYRGDRIRLGLISEAGFEYVSAQGWGPGRTMPAPVTAPYAYADEGFPCLLEIPMHGWHENILTRVHPWQSPSQPLSPEAPRTVDEWCAPFATDMLTALESELPYYGPTMHPWSLRRFAPDCRQVEALLRLAREHGFRFARFSEFRDDWLAGRVA